MLCARAAKSVGRNCTVRAPASLLPAARCAPDRHCPNPLLLFTTVTVAMPYRSAVSSSDR